MDKSSDLSQEEDNKDLSKLEGLAKSPRLIMGFTQKRRLWSFFKVLMAATRPAAHKEVSRFGRDNLRSDRSD